MAYAYPILLDLAGKLVVIVGGGKVAVRKAAGAIDGGATRVRCVAPKIDAEMPAQVERIEKTFEPVDVDGATLVFAATDQSAVNSAVVRAAQERKILVSRADADEQDAGDFIVPAVLRRGPIVVSVAAGSPALAAKVRDQLSTALQTLHRYTQLAEALKTLRPMLVDSKTLTAQRRRAALLDLVTAPALEALGQDGKDGLWRWLVERYPELKPEQSP